MESGPKLCITLVETEKIDIKKLNIDKIFDQIKTKYDIMYCGLYEIDGSISLYIHNKSKMYSKKLNFILQKYLLEKGHLKITGIVKYFKIHGNIISKSGEIPIHGGSRKRTKISNNITTVNNIHNGDVINNNINVIFTNPMKKLMISDGKTMKKKRVLIRGSGFSDNGVWIKS